MGLFTPRTSGPGRAVPLWVSVLVGAVMGAVGVLLGVQPGERPPLVPTTPPGVTDNPVRPIEYEGLPYEAEHLGEHQDGKAFPVKRITYVIDFANVDTIRPATTPAAIREAFRTAWASWASGLDIDPVEAGPGESPHVMHTFARIDGAGKTLAWSMLGDGSVNTKVQRYDTAETWTLGGPAPNQISLPAVAVHEIGHALGLDHDTPTADSIMRPHYNSAITRATERDFHRAVSIGYRRRSAAGPGDPPGQLLDIVGRVRAVDAAEALRRSGWKVDAPGK